MSAPEPGDMRRNPFVGPVPFLEGQTLYGRERETDELSDLLVSKRIVLLFAPSGAGKTSLIQAALIPRLRDRYRLEPLPIVRLAHRNDAVAGPGGVNRYTLSTMRSLERRLPREQQLADQQLAEFTLAGYFERRLAPGRDTGRPGYRLLVLDQFEELFTLDPLDWDAKKAFLKALGQVLAGAQGEGAEVESQGPLTIWALFSMREDRVAELQPFLDLIPTALAFRYRLDPLERDEALDAVTKPAGSYITAAAAERLVDDLRTMQLRTPDGKEVLHQGRFVEPVQLQVVCHRLWNKVVAKDDRPVELADVTAAGGVSEVDRALGDFFDAEVAEAASATGVAQRQLRDWIEDCLITATGIRAQALREPASLGKVNDAIGRLIDAHLIRSDVRNDREWIELAHDRLVGPIRTGNKEWRNRNLQPFQQQAKLWTDSGKTHRDMLFVREELAEAERFAEAHPNELNEDEKQFLAESRREREGIAAEHATKRKLALLTALAFAMAGATYWVTTRLELQKLSHEVADAQQWLGTLSDEARKQEAIAQIARATGMTREGRSLAALGLLLQLEKGVESLNLDPYPNALDRAFLEALSNAPAVVADVGRHRHIVRSLAFGADGKRLISGAWDGSIAIWRLDRPGKPVFETPEQATEIYAIALHEAAGLLAATYIDGRIVLWRVTGDRLQPASVLNADGSIFRKQVTTAEFSPNGALLATAGWDKTIVLWDVSSPDAPRRVASFGSRYHLAPIQHIVFLPNDGSGDRLASTDLDGRVRIWRLGTGASRSAPQPERDFAVSDILQRNVGLYSAAADPKGRWLAAGDSDGYVYLWDLAADDPRRSGVRLMWDRHGRGSVNAAVYDLAFSPDGNTLVSVGVDEVVLRWTLPVAPKTVRDLDRDIRVARIEGLSERLYSVAFDPSRAATIAVGGTRTIRMVDLGRREPALASAPAPLATPPGGWRAVSMDRGSSTIAAATEDDRIMFLRRTPDRIEFVPQWTIVADPKSSHVLHPDGKSLVSAGCGSVTLWELVEAGPPVRKALASGTLPADSCPFAEPVFSPNGNVLATAAGSKLALWVRDDRRSWKQQSALSFDDDGGDPGGVAAGRPEHINSLAFSPTSDLLAVGGAFGRIRLLRIEGGKPASSFLPGSVDAGKATLALAFRPDGSALLSGGEEGFITEWALPGLRQTAVSTLHQRSVTSLAFAPRAGDSSPSIPVLFSADRDGDVRAWIGGIGDDDAIPIKHASGRPVRALAAGTNGEFLMTAGDQLLAWDLRREAMVQLARRLMAR